MPSGTFTPTLVGSSANPSVTYGVQHGMYVRIGQLAYVELRVSWSALSGGSGNLRVHLPAALGAANDSNFSNILATRVSGPGASPWVLRGRPGSSDLDVVADGSMSLSAAAGGGDISASGLLRLNP